MTTCSGSENCGFGFVASLGSVPPQATWSGPGWGSTVFVLAVAPVARWVGRWFRSRQAPSCVSSPVNAAKAIPPTSAITSATTIVVA